MSETAREALATVSVEFYGDGNAQFKFNVNKEIAQPTSRDLGVIAFAKIFSELVGSLAGSPAMQQINQLVERVAQNPSMMEDDD